MFSGLLAGLVLMPATDPAPAPPAVEAHRDALARYGAAVWQARRDRLLTAARQLEAAARQDPDATAPLKELVRVYSLIGREPDAIRAARKVLAKNPRDADTAHALARLLSDSGEAAEALAAVKLAAESPELADRPDKAVAVYRDLATLLEATGEPAVAATALQKALDVVVASRKDVIAAGAFTPREADTAAAEVYERLGKAFTRAEKFADAADAFKAAARLYADTDKANDPGAAARLEWNLSGVYAAKGDPAAALPHLEAFLKLRPQAAEPYERLASLLRQADRERDIVPALRAYADRDPKNLPLLAVHAAEQARDPPARRDADAAFTKLAAATNDRAVLRVMLRSHVQTDRAGLIVAEIDGAYEAAKGENTPAEKLAFAAEKARVLAELLRAEPEWAVAVLRAATADLEAGTRRLPQTWHLLGSVAAHHRRLDFAAGLFTQAVRTPHRETEYDAYAGLIDTLRRQRKPGRVADVCRDGLRRAEAVQPVFFHYHLALALAELGEAEEAIAAADKAILQAGDGNRLVARLCKVSVYRTLGRWDEAVSLGKKLLDEFDAPADRLRVRYTLSGAYWGAKKYPEAEAELRAILDADPDHAAAANDLGYHLADLGRDLDEAERLIRHAVAVDRADRRKAGDPEPDNAAYLDSLGWVLFRKGGLPEARKWLEKAAAMPDGATDPTVWDHLGDVYFRLGEKVKAKAAWEQAATLYVTDLRGKRDGRLDEVKRKLKRLP